jgi:hypothetical protein
VGIEFRFEFTFQDAQTIGYLKINKYQSRQNEGLGRDLSSLRVFLQLFYPRAFPRPFYLRVFQEIDKHGA